MTGTDGTGHGVGHFLNVHEGPHGIGTRASYQETALKAGMVVSNEPGFYKQGHFGIRIESLVYVQPVSSSIIPAHARSCTDRLTTGRGGQRLFEDEAHYVVSDSEDVD